MGRKLAEAESARLAAIVDSSNDAIVSASLAGVIESWNPAAERIFGYRASEVLGRPLSLLVPRQSTDQTPQHLGQVRTAPRSPISGGAPPQGRHPDRRVHDPVAGEGLGGHRHRDVGDRAGESRKSVATAGVSSGSFPRCDEVERVLPG